jgi:hypothetical protein
MHHMQTKGIHVHDGGVSRIGRPEGYPSHAFVDLGSPHDDEADGPSFGGGRRNGKEPMAEDTRGMGNDSARDIRLRVTMGSTRKGSSGKKSARQTKSTMVALKQAMYDELRKMAKARKEVLLR